MPVSLTIAMEAGLASSQAFAKVFRRYYCCAPGEFRRDKSKNEHLIRKDGHAIGQLNPYAEVTLSARNNTMKTLKMNARALPTPVSSVPMAKGMIRSMASCINGPLPALLKVRSGSKSITIIPKLVHQPRVALTAG